MFFGILFTICLALIVIASIAYMIIAVSEFIHDKKIDPVVLMIGIVLLAIASVSLLGLYFLLIKYPFWAW